MALVFVNLGKFMVLYQIGRFLDDLYTVLLNVQTSSGNFRYQLGYKDLAMATLWIVDRIKTWFRHNSSIE